VRKRGQVGEEKIPSLVKTVWPWERGEEVRKPEDGAVKREGRLWRVDRSFKKKRGRDRATERARRGIGRRGGKRTPLPSAYCWGKKVACASKQKHESRWSPLISASEGGFLPWHGLFLVVQGGVSKRGKGGSNLKNQIQVRHFKSNGEKCKLRE